MGTSSRMPRSSFHGSGLRRRSVLGRSLAAAARGGRGISCSGGLGPRSHRARCSSVGSHRGRARCGRGLRAHSPHMAPSGLAPNCRRIPPRRWVVSRRRRVDKRLGTHRVVSGYYNPRNGPLRGTPHDTVFVRINLAPDTTSHPSSSARTLAGDAPQFPPCT